MTSVRTHAGPIRSAPRLGRWPYLAASFPFFLIFTASAVQTFADLEATRLETVGLGFPAWAVIPLGIAKVLGLLAILSRRSRLLTGLAFAGFFYDILLALGAWVAQRDLPNIAIATVGLLATGAAYWAHERRHPSAR